MKSPYKKWLEKAKGKLFLTLSFTLYMSSCMHPMQLTISDGIKISNILLEKDTTAPKKPVFAMLDHRKNTGDISDLYKLRNIWNYNVVNSEEVEEISLFIFNDLNQIDTVLTKRIKSELIKKNYTVTKPVIYYDKINPEIANNIKSAKLDFFKGALYKSTDYICVGIVSYSYLPNEFRKDITDCTMQINYYIYSASTGVVMFSESDKIISSGISKEMARYAAIQRFIL